MSLFVKTLVLIWVFKTTIRFVSCFIYPTSFPDYFAKMHRISNVWHVQDMILKDAILLVIKLSLENRLVASGFRLSELILSPTRYFCIPYWRPRTTLRTCFRSCSIGVNNMSMESWLELVSFGRFFNKAECIVHKNWYNRCRVLTDCSKSGTFCQHWSWSFPKVNFIFVSNTINRRIV